MELGWQILDYESGLYSEMSTTLDSITTLTALYMVETVLTRESLKDLTLCRILENNTSP